MEFDLAILCMAGAMVAGALVMCMLPSVEAVQHPLIWRPFQVTLPLNFQKVPLEAVVSQPGSVSS